MYSFWNPYYPQFFMPLTSMFSIPSVPILVNPTAFINSSPTFLNGYPSSAQMQKNTDRTTQESSKNVIQINSGSQQQNQQVKPKIILEKKDALSNKIKTDRFLGFKQGIFGNENNIPTKVTRNLRKRAVLIETRLRKYKQKNVPQKIKRKRKAIQKPMKLRKLRQCPRQSKNQGNDRNKSSEKKPRYKQFGRLKKYLKCVQKTVKIPEMHLLKNNLRKTIQEKKENLLLRKID